MGCWTFIFNIIGFNISLLDSQRWGDWVQEDRREKGRAKRDIEWKRKCDVEKMNEMTTSYKTLNYSKLYRTQTCCLDLIIKCTPFKTTY